MLYHFGTLSDHPRPLRRIPELATYLLTPGFSRSYHRHVLGVSDTTISKYMKWSEQAAETDPTIQVHIAENLASISPEDGLMFAQRRGHAHLPYWSRLAIADYAHRLQDTGKVAAIFQCTRRTVQLVLRTCPLAYDPFTCARRLSETQLRPPGMWTPKKAPSKVEV